MDRRNQAELSDLEIEAKERVLDYLSSKMPLADQEGILIVTRTADAVVVPCGCGVRIMHVHDSPEHTSGPCVLIEWTHCAAHGNRADHHHLLVSLDGGIAPLSEEAVRAVFS